MTMVTNTYDEAERQENVIRIMREYPVDGLAYAPALGSEPPSVGIPALAITRRSEDGSPSLVLDEIEGGKLAADHLARVHGARRFVYLGGPEGAVPAQERVEGLNLALSEIPGAKLVRVMPGQTSTQSGMELAVRLLSDGVAFDAVICHSDVIAYSLLHELRLHQPQRKVPVGVIGFDGLPESAVFNPTVTSVAVGPEAMGRQAAQWLIDALTGGGKEAIPPLRPHLEVRASCGCPDGVLTDGQEGQHTGRSC
jgi:LacI family transcriptional regulator